MRFADNPEVIGSNHANGLVLLRICRIKRDYSYLPTGTLRRTSSKKFSRNITGLSVNGITPKIFEMDRAACYCYLNKNSEPGGKACRLQPRIPGSSSWPEMLNSKRLSKNTLAVNPGSIICSNSRTPKFGRFYPAIGSEKTEAASERSNGTDRRTPPARIDATLSASVPALAYGLGTKQTGSSISGSPFCISGKQAKLSLFPLNNEFRPGRSVGC